MSDDKPEQISPEDLEKIQSVIKEIHSGSSRRNALLKSNISAFRFDKLLLSSPDLLSQYERAQESRAEDDADEVVEIADNEAIDPHRARNMIDARKWRASKMKPKKFGDRIDLNVTQIVDIRSALIEANARIQLPISYPRQSQDEQSIEVKDVTPSLTTGSEPVETKDPIENESDDIFS